MDARVGRTGRGTLALARASAEEAGAGYLTADEERTASRLPDERRADFVAGRLAAKRAVAALLAAAGAAVPRRAIQIHAGRSGAPRARILPGPIPLGALLARAAGGESCGPWMEPSVALSLAHRDGRALAAAAIGGRVGVDLERAWAVHPASVRYFCPPAERRAYSRFDVDATSLWTLREAAWKALECTPALPFHALRLELDPAGRPVAVAREEPGAGPTPLLPAAGRLWRPWPGYLGAVVLVDVEAVGEAADGAQADPGEALP